MFYDCFNTVLMVLCLPSAVVGVIGDAGDCRVITKLSIGGQWEFLFTRWPPDIRLFLPTSRSRSMRRSCLERSEFISPSKVF